MGEVSRAVVRIGGLEYTIKGKESEEYLHKVAICVDKKMREIEKTHFNLSTSMRAVLVSINMANDMLKRDEEIKKLKQKIGELQEENELLNEMLVQLEKESSSTPNIYDVSDRN
ncbi:MAG: cell division protein ZapA [Clostridiales bacterium]|nr:cell division protein ZapA [Clostridiales bacterium]